MPAAAEHTETSTGAGHGVCWAAVLAGVAQAAVGLAIVALTHLERLAASETDGHVLRAGYLACGDSKLFFAGSGMWPWLQAWLTALLTHPLGEGYLAGRVVSVLAMATLCATVSATAWRVWRSWELTLVAALVVGTTPQLLFYGTLATTDMLAVAITTLALPFALSVLRGERVGWSALAVGAIGALAAQARYQVFPMVIVLGATLAVVAPAGRRARTGLAFAAGLLGGLVVASQVMFAPPGSWGGLAIAWSSRGRVSESLSFADSLARYANSAHLVLWHVNYLPLLGLVALARFGLDQGRPRRDALVLLAPLAAQFAALGRFPALDGPELRRLFLPFLPICALGVAVAWRRLRLWRGPGRLVTAPLFAAWALLTVNQGFDEFPVLTWFSWGVPYPDLGPVSPQRRWDFDREPGRDDELKARQAGVDALRALEAQVDLGCTPAVTNSGLASTVLPSVVYCPTGTPACGDRPRLDNASVDALLADGVSRFGVRWVLEEPVNGTYGIDPSAPLSSGARIVERPVGGPFRLYEVVPASPR